MSTTVPAARLTLLLCYGLALAGCSGAADVPATRDVPAVIDAADAFDAPAMRDDEPLPDTPPPTDTPPSLDAGLAHDADTLDAARADRGAPSGDLGAPRMDAGAPRMDAGPAEPDEVERTWRVLHWNIAGGKENDCEPGLITRAVVRYVREHDVDFVGLNEVCPAQFAAIESALRDHWALGPRFDFAAFVGDGQARVVGNALYSRLGVQNVTRQMVGADQYGARNLLCAQVAALPHLRVCSTHLTPGDATARVQLGRVLDQIEQWWDTRRDTVILTGDLNLTPNDPGLNAVYSDAASTRNNPDNRGRYRELDDADPAHCPGYGERSVPNTTGGPCGAGGKIDFLFVRENRIVDGAYTGDTFDIPTDCTGVCSDHRAVWGRVRVRVRAD